MFPDPGGHVCCSGEGFVLLSVRSSLVLLCEVGSWKVNAMEMQSPKFREQLWVCGCR